MKNVSIISRDKYYSNILIIAKLFKAILFQFYFFND